MKYILTILSLWVITSNSQVRWQKPKANPIYNISNSTPTPPSGNTDLYTFTVDPLSALDRELPFRGEEQWHGGNEVNIPSSGSQIARANVYKRSFYPLNQLMPGPNTFDFSTMIADLQDAINNHQRMSIGAPLTFFDGADGNYYANITGGGLAAFSQWLKDSIAIVEPSAPCWRTNGTGQSSSGTYWVLPWQSNVGFRALERFLTAFKNVLNQTYQGVRYGDIINTLDIRWLGNYGEGHSVNIVDGMSNYPTGTRMTTAVWQRVIDDYCAILGEYQLQVMIAAFDCHRLPAVIDNDQAVAFYALSKTYGTNNSKRLGWRKDSYGSNEDYLPDLLQNNTNTFGGMRFDTAILNRYLYAPIMGEPNSGLQMTNLGRDVRIYHTTSVGNSNYNATLSPASQDSIRAASKQMGYRISIDSGRITSTIVKGTPFNISIYLHNNGLNPFYLNWPVKYTVRNSSNVEVYSATSTAHVYYFQPTGTANTVFNDVVTIPTSVASGSGYSISIIVADPTGYNTPFTFYNSGRQTDGRYQIKTGITL